MKYKRLKNKKKKYKSRILGQGFSKKENLSQKKSLSSSRSSSKEGEGKKRDPLARPVYERKKAGRINFLGKSKYFTSLSFLLTLIALVCIFLKSFNYGIDFAGGTEIQIQFSKALKTEDLRALIQQIKNEDLKDRNYTLQSFGGKNEFLLRIESLEEKKQVKPLKRENQQVQKKEQHEKKTSEGKKEKNKEVASQEKKGEGEAEGIEKNRGGEKKENQDVQSVGFRTQSMIEDILNEMKEKFKDSNPTIRRVDSVGPQIGSELKRNGLLALFYSLLIILIYVGLRFDYKYAPGAVFCLFHDAIITLGIFSFFGFEINVQTMAAVLTIIGYSLNDTIVNFDRVRENVQIFRDLNFKVLVNRSINEVLSRTLLTSATTLIALGAMYFISGGVIRDFAFTLGIGVIIGTYSSIYVASPLVIFVDRLQKMGS